VKKLNIVAAVCRVVLGLTFVFSGFVKSVDPWGMALKIGEYLNVYGAGAVGDGVRIALAVLACAAELTLGLMLVFRVKMRLTSIAALVVMLFFLVLTFLSATVLPVEDCGCFGDALHLSPWASFGKNVVLTALAVVVWWSARRRGEKILPVTLREWISTAAFGCLSVGLGLFCYLHLPLIDFLPFREGVNLYEAKYGEDPSGTEGDIALREFVLFNSAGDATEEILSNPGRTYVLFAATREDMTTACALRFEKLVERASGEGSRVVVATSSPLPEGEKMLFGASAPVDAYNLDSGTMITALRARTGVVVIENGVIIDKKNCRDI
jgi:uncharacterized membrane protein YphA (DoxX/SURF4 family)